MWEDYSEDEIAEMLAWQEILQDTGKYGESIAEATSARANPTYTGPGAIRYIADHTVNYAEQAAEIYRKQHQDDMPPGAVIYLDRKEY
jgi:hypothetical protein